jgi:hypothetical protein
MKKKTLTIIPILLYSGFSSASLYIHQESESNKEVSSNFNVIYDEKPLSKTRSIESKKEKLVAKGKESFIKDTKPVVKNKTTKEEFNETDVDNIPKYSEITHNTPSDIVPYTKTIYAKMDKGNLSNSMRKHLESLGWELRWSSGSDRKVTVPFIIEHKDVIGFAEEISKLYDIFIDVYPQNKTVSVSQ